MGHRSDSLLVADSLNGDSRSFDELVRRYRHTVLTLAQRVLKDYDDAQDVTQVAFTKAYLNLHTLKQSESFARWIARIAINESINHMRQRSSSLALVHQPIAADESPADRHKRRQLADRVDGALMGLRMDARMLIVMRYFGDLTYRELSFIFEMPVRTVKSRLHSARQRLSALLAQTNSGPSFQKPSRIWRHRGCQIRKTRRLSRQAPGKAANAWEA